MRLIVGLAMVLLVGGADNARGSCDGGADQTFGSGGSIPDNDATGAWFVTGPTTGDGACMSDASLVMFLIHPIVGDLKMRLGYDRDCDGAVDTELVTILCRPGRDCEEGSGRGCTARTSGSYRISDEATSAIGDPTCVDPVAAGCYLQAPESTTDMSIFDDESLGGCFRLFASDHAAGDVGFLKQFRVSYDAVTCVTPVDTLAWGQLKHRF